MRWKDGKTWKPCKLKVTHRFWGLLSNTAVFNGTSHDCFHDALLKLYFALLCKNTKVIASALDLKKHKQNCDISRLNYVQQIESIVFQKNCWSWRSMLPKIVLKWLNKDGNDMPHLKHSTIRYNVFSFLAVCQNIYDETCFYLLQRNSAKMFAQYFYSCIGICIIQTENSKQLFRHTTLHKKPHRFRDKTR